VPVPDVLEPDVPEPDMFDELLLLDDDERDVLRARVAARRARVRWAAVESRPMRMEVSPDILIVVSPDIFIVVSVDVFDVVSVGVP
jgi:hypothetical protein